MLKKSLQFYWTCTAFGFIFYMTVGGVVGWFVTESESKAISLVVGVAGFLVTVFIGFVLFKNITKNGKYGISDILKLLLPHFIMICIYSVLFVVNVLKEQLISFHFLYEIMESGMLKWLLAFLSPVSYSTVMIWGACDFSYIAFYASNIIGLVVYCLCILLYAYVKEKQEKQGMQR